MPSTSPRPAVIDLFSGVGGLSLGAARAGFRVAASVELDEIASKSHADNFPATSHWNTDVAKLTGDDLLQAAAVARGQLGGLIGGPTCQGFSLIGRRNIDDPRNDLFGQFFRLVSETQPAFYVAENVPGILSPNTNDFISRARDLVPRHYVNLEPVKVQAHLFGAPTTRARVFFVGFDPDRIGALTANDFSADPATTQIVVRTALAGLPGVREDWQREEQSWRKVDHDPSTEFGARLVDRVPNGVGNSLALRRLKNSGEVSGFLGTKHDPRTIERFATLKQGDVDPVYRAPRLRWDGFCPTLRAGTAKDKGSYQAVRPIHPKNHRVISPREAARLQGFPDWFVFNPTKWHSFRQIGNSVSPIVAEAILSKIYSRL